jgi:LacI family transcriptional regulator/LacI family repressor for deo operon, udp, cdd, tsx, nupC, and nupG
MRRPRVTQKDVAALAGVHRTTVSLVLRNHPAISEETRQLVLRAIEETGYQPDPMLSALAAYRSSSRRAVFHGTLAWLVNHQGSEYRWKETRIYREYFEGAQQSASRHGYILEVFDLNLNGLTSQRLAGILRARNIQGVILCPQPTPQTQVDFPWENVAAITFGHTLSEPRLHLGTATQYRNAVNTVRKMQEYGYKRIAYDLWQEFDRRSDNNYWAGYLVEMFSLTKGLAIPPLDRRSGDTKAFRRWYERYRPDAIVTGDPMIIDYLASVGLRVPEDIGAACVALSDANSPLAGMYENSTHVGEVVVDFLVGMIHRGEYGIPEHRQRIFVEGTWITGMSLPRKT